jgi:gamma-glutamyltranspeptidase/glutathione hydrolase
VVGRSLICALATALVLAPPAGAVAGSRFQAALRSAGAVVAAENPQAAEAARQVLDRGGNAMDAAVAAAFAVGVTRPQMCGLGGGGYLVWRSSAGDVTALDFRERAPAATRADTMSGDSSGLHRTGTGHLTVGVPGFVRGVADALARHGTMTLAQVIAPAERLARDGFPVPRSLSAHMAGNAQRLKLFPAAARQFLVRGERAYATGATLRQPDLARTLARIADEGPDGFYAGPVAEAIAADMQAAGQVAGDRAILTLQDLADYRARWRPLVTASYRGHQVTTMGPSTSGGVALVEILNIIEGFDLRGMGQSSADAIHVIAEAEKIAMADRGAYAADPDVVDVPVGELTSAAYAADRRRDIDLATAATYKAGRFGEPASPPGEGDGDEPPPAPAGHTTHVSVIDGAGNAVALTCTLARVFGSAVVAPGTGVVLNNDMNNFSAPGTANEPGPGKRPRGNMAPTIVSRGGRLEYVIGGAGGQRIIMGVLLSLVNAIDYGQDVAHAIDTERFDVLTGLTLRMEDQRISALVRQQLADRGHKIQRAGEYDGLPFVVGAAVEPETGLRAASSDPRSDLGTVASEGPGAAPPGAPVLADQAASPDLRPPRVVLDAPRYASDRATDATVTVGVSATDGTGSGVAALIVRPRLNGLPLRPFARRLPLPVLSLPGRPGSVLDLDVRAVDRAGNTGPPARARVVVPFDDLARLRFGPGWRRARAPDFYGGSVAVARRSEARATATVIARTIAVIGTRSPGGGRLLVDVDGRRRVVVSARGPLARRQVLATLGGLKPGTHRLTITALGGGMTDVDAVAVASTPAARRRSRGG